MRQRLAALSASGRFDAVLRLALSADFTDSGDAALIAFQAGAVALKRNDAFGAVTAFEQARRDDPDLPALSDALASAYRRDARYADCLTVTGKNRQCRYEQGLSLLALGRGSDGLAMFDAILADDSDHAVSWFASHAAALEIAGWDEAMRRLERAVDCPGANGRYRTFLTAYALLRGKDQPSIEIAPRHAALADGVRALLPHCPSPPVLFGLSASVLRFAMAQALGAGLVLEFGVRRGTSTTVLAEVAGQALHGFDSFEGLPQSWGNEPAGVLTTGASLPPVPPNVILHPGWFEDTLDPFLAGHPGPVRLVNIDSDIYASASFVLDRLRTRIVPGTVLVFDEFIGNRNWAEDEFKAFAEYVAQTGVQWHVLAVAPFTKQVVLVIDES